MLSSKDGGDQGSYLRVGQGWGGGLGLGNLGQDGGGGGDDGHVLDHSLRAELGGGDDLGGALHQRGGHLSAPEGDGDDGGVLRGDGGHVGAGVGHKLGGLSCLDGSQGLLILLTRVGGATQQQLLQQTVEQRVLVHWLHYPGAHCLHVVDGGGEDVLE